MVYARGVFVGAHRFDSWGEFTVLVLSTFLSQSNRPIPKRTRRELWNYRAGHQPT
jgi:hypothetical protein